MTHPHPKGHVHCIARYRLHHKPEITLNPKLIALFWEVEPNRESTKRGRGATLRV
jgi:hypothetical protein